MKLDGNTLVFDKPNDREELEDALKRTLNTWGEAPRSIRILYYQLVAARAAIDASTYNDLARNINAQSDAQNVGGGIRGQEEKGEVPRGTDSP